jgi:hypothetical protein
MVTISLPEVLGFVAAITLVLMICVWENNGRDLY